MRASFDYRSITAVVALTVVVGLAVPVVSGAGAGAAPSAPRAESVAVASPESSEPGLTVTPAPVTDDDDFVAASAAPAPTATTASPRPTATGSTSTGSSTSTGTSTVTASPVPIYLPIAEESPAPTAGSCPAAISGTTPGAPSRTSPLGVSGTTSTDLQLFAEKYNAIRVANCLPPVPFSNIRYDSCMEDRLFWMAEDPSTDPMSAWGHIGSQRSDGVPSVGCDGNLAGGTDNTGTTVAQKWWDSSGHRSSLYKPTYTGSTTNVCILFAMTHGGVPNEPYSFTRAAARWTSC
jgi:uncharacterized protein YkwD